MKRAMQLGVLGIGVLAVVVLVLLAPIVPMSVSYLPCKQCVGGLFLESASASVSYAYFGAGMVLVPNAYPSTGHTYCWLSGDGESGTICGYAMERV